MGLTLEVNDERVARELSWRFPNLQVHFTGCASDLLGRWRRGEIPLGILRYSWEFQGQVNRQGTLAEKISLSLVCDQYQLELWSGEATFK